MSYKVVIIGGGPGGYVAAIRAAQMGARVALVEKDEVGGTCLNWGCIPTKALVAGAEILHRIRRAEEFGIRVGEVSIDYARLVERKDAVVNKLVSGVHYLLKKNKVEFIRGTAKLAGPGKVVVSLQDGSTAELAAENIILATGTRPALIDAFGYDGDRVITSNEALSLKEIPGAMLIIGGGVVGCEFACIFAEMGCRVTIAEAMPSILPLIERDASRQMQTLLKRKGINIKTKVKIEKVEKSGDKVTAILEGGETIEADKILISIGRVMNTSGLGLEEAGVRLGQRGEVLVDEHLATGVPGIYAIGDITGKIQLAHVASAQALVAVDNIMGQPRQMNYDVVPNCIFTMPEVAGVGLTTQQCEEKGIKPRVGKFPFMASGKAAAMGETDGFVKILADPATDKVLGVHIVGPHATDLIAEAALAMELGATVEQMTQVIHAHPTLAESILEAAEAVHGRAIHI
ncbi:dihydrolipoamide dehydrogenase [Desulforamulus putei DSM 12395]|uniref:Dihydrolipoyl dehydrogenase n=1 Tax=Desulforamulus putei DSM 12395 TaxID=1121429 RepID=A0A1M4TTM0_9FIRM|nr:dihydrolipoyl dehydrogenase [Desulforamulus putei]SHE47745.1 dihydrolipoamide dehydrogenase [Desulforamulus putei DSM 12395]